MRLTANEVRGNPSEVQILSSPQTKSLTLLGGAFVCSESDLGGFGRSFREAETTGPLVSALKGPRPFWAGLSYARICRCGDLGGGAQHRRLLSSPQTKSLTLLGGAFVCSESDLGGFGSRMRDRKRSLAFGTCGTLDRIRE